MARVLLFVLAAQVLPALADETVITITAAPTTPSAAPQFVTASLFTSAVLNSTNYFRHEFNASTVVYNSTLASFASSYLSQDSDCNFAHSGGPYGENIALGCTDVQGCVDLWGDEYTGYDWNNPQFSESTGHFTQLVWRNTTSVGCGSRLCGTSGWFLVCEYWPRGNVIGEFGDEVGQKVSAAGAGLRGGVTGKPSLAAAAAAAFACTVMLTGSLPGW